MPLSKKQLKLRSSALFASEIVALFPEYAMPYQKNVLELYAEKTGVGSLREAKGKAIDAGNFWEDTIARAWAKENGYKLFKGQTSIRPEDEFGFPLGATPDRIACKMPAEKTRREGVEAKNVGLQDSSVWGEEPAGAAFHVIIQTAVQVMVCKFPVVHIPICIGGNDRRTYRYESNHELEQLIVERGKWFWEIIKTRAWHERLPELPEITEEIKRRFLVKLFPTNQEPPIQATQEDITLYDDWGTAKAELKQIEEREKYFANLALTRLGNSNAIIAPDGKKLFSKVVKAGGWVERFYRKESVYPQINLPRKRAEVYNDEVS